MIAKPVGSGRCRQSRWSRPQAVMMLSYYATTGETDFLMICEAADGEDIIPALMVAGAGVPPSCGPV